MPPDKVDHQSQKTDDTPRKHARALTVEEAVRKIHDQNQTSDTLNIAGVDAAYPPRKSTHASLGTAALGAPGSGSGNKHTDQLKPVATQSVLDFAVHTALDPVVGLFTDNKNAKDVVTDGAKQILKTAPLFMAGRWAGAATLATYASDEVKTSDRGMDLIIDASLGIAKGGALKLSQHYLMARNETPSMLGVELGVVNRATEVGLTRENYYDKKGDFSLGLGLSKAGMASVQSIGTDALVYGVADRFVGKAFLKSRGESTFNPVFTSAIAGGAFNTTTAAGAEVSRQISDGKFDPVQLTTRSIESGIIGVGSGMLAGMQRRSYLSLNVKDGPMALAEARSTPRQTGQIVDESQAVFRDGKFIASEKVNGPTGTHYLGKLQTPGGERDAIFRINDGTESFAHRMQSEIAGYHLNKEIGFNNKFATTVARTIEVDGVQHSGFIQEMRGQNLVQHFGEKVNTPGKLRLDKDAVLDAFRADPEFRSSYMESWAERMTLGEWDNHALNQVTLRTRVGVEVPNIDLGDGLKPAKTQLDLVPHPGIRKSYEKINSHLYNEVAGSQLSPEVTQKFQSFVERNDSDAGRAKLQGFGLTPQQVEGVLGRSNWFASNEILPYGRETPGSTVVGKILWPGRVAYRLAKSKIKSALDH